MKKVALLGGWSHHLKRYTLATCKASKKQNCFVEPNYMNYYTFVAKVDWKKIFIPSIIEPFLNFVIDHYNLNPLGLVGFAAKQNRRFCSCSVELANQVCRMYRQLWYVTFHQLLRWYEFEKMVMMTVSRAEEMYQTTSPLKAEQSVFNLLDRTVSL